MTNLLYLLYKKLKEHLNINELIYISKNIFLYVSINFTWFIFYEILYKITPKYITFYG